MDRLNVLKVIKYTSSEFTIYGELLLIAALIVLILSGLCFFYAMVNTNEEKIIKPLRCKCSFDVFMSMLCGSAVFGLMLHMSFQSPVFRTEPVVTSVCYKVELTDGMTVEELNEKYDIINSYYDNDLQTTIYTIEEKGELE